MFSSGRNSILDCVRLPLRESTRLECTYTPFRIEVPEHAGGPSVTCWICEVPPTSRPLFSTDGNELILPEGVMPNDPFFEHLAFSTS